MKRASLLATMMLSTVAFGVANSRCGVIRDKRLLTKYDLEAMERARLKRERKSRKNSV